MPPFPIFYILCGSRNSWSFYFICFGVFFSSYSGNSGLLLFLYYDLKSNVRMIFLNINWIITLLCFLHFNGFPLYSGFLTYNKTQANSLSLSVSLSLCCWSPEWFYSVLLFQLHHMTLFLLSSPWLENTFFKQQIVIILNFWVIQFLLQLFNYAIITSSSYG